jgi:hypothetical protein
MLNKKTFLKINFLLSLFILLLAGCMGSASSKRAKAIDFSVTTGSTTTSTGCGTTQYVAFSNLSSTTTSPTYSCSTSCATNYHVATTSELNNFLETYTQTTISTMITGSKGLCLSDSSALRPTGEVYITSDFCSCLNGKSDIINDCDTYCASLSTTTAPILHVNSTLGSAISGNTKLGSLYNWCNTQLDGDTSTPQCTLSAWDGTNTIDNIPVNISKTANTFTADISSLAYNTTYVVTLVESKTGSNAASTGFNLRRVKQSSSTDSTVGSLKITPVSQYTCLTYGGTTDSAGVITRTTYARVFYYYPANETPAPIPGAGGTNQNTVVCHDEVSNPGNDNALYPRLELIPSQFTLWDKTEPRFVKTNNVMAINSTIQTRLSEEYGVTSTIDIFTLISYPNRPNITSSSTTSTQANVAQGYMMVPFINSTTSKAYCPTSTEYNSSQSLFRILKDYMGNTEGLYLGEKEAELVQDGTSYKTIYGTMFATETILKSYGFYIQNGIKVKATADSLHNKTIYYYWPVSTTMDPLLQGDRKLYTIRYSDQLNGNSPSGVTNTVRPSDKRIGCVPVTTTN